MTTCYKIEVEASDPLSGLRRLTERVLGLESIDAVLAPLRPAGSPMIMPTLVSDPAKLAEMDPLAPAFALNGARMASRLTYRPSGHSLAVMLRPCEIRAFVELEKLNQAAREEIVLISCDCLGAMDNRTYLQSVGRDVGEASREFYGQRLAQPLEMSTAEPRVATACKVCEHPVPQGVDLAVLLYGVDTRTHIVVQPQSEKGEKIAKALGYPETIYPDGRQGLVDALIEQRIEARDRMFADTRAAIDTPAKLRAYLAACVNCYNCRVACPVCYCRECVFATDVFVHEPFQYVDWARRRGAVKLPTDTALYHLTRLAHMSTACVGCGQCTNACPNGIGVMELFRTVSHGTQAVFSYSPGTADQPPPLTQFKETEFEEVVGLGE